MFYREVFNMVENKTISFINMPIDQLKQEYIDGSYFDLEMSEKIATILNRGEYKYVDKIKQIKEILNKSKHYVIDDVMLFYCDEELSEVDIATMVRYINLTYKGKYFIAINNKLVYMPKDYSEVSTTYVNYYINELMRNYYKYIQKNAPKT